MSRTGLLGALVFLSLVGCSSEAPIESLPPPRAVLDSVGKRLAGSYREVDITALGEGRESASRRPQGRRAIRPRPRPDPLPGGSAGRRRGGRR